MILVTGGSDFVGRAVLRHLNLAGYPVRTLLRPSKKSPHLPHGIPVEVALSSLVDPQGLRAAMVGVDTLIHLPVSIRTGRGSGDGQADAEETRSLAQAAAEAGVARMIYLSSIGADRASAYRRLRDKGLAEWHIQSCGIPSTILRPSLVYGEGDRFTTGLAMLIAISPLIFPIPGEGKNLLQPLWVEDLATCIAWMLDDSSTIGRVIEVGGPEFCSLEAIVRLVMDAIGKPRIILPTRPPYLRVLSVLMERSLPHPPLAASWMDYLAANRIASLDTLPRVFGLQPSRLEARLNHLRGINWSARFIRRQFSR